MQEHFYDEHSYRQPTRIAFHRILKKLAAKSHYCSLDYTRTVC